MLMQDDVRVYSHLMCRVGMDMSQNAVGRHLVEIARHLPLHRYEVGDGTGNVNEIHRNSGINLHCLLEEDHEVPGHAHHNLRCPVQPFCVMESVCSICLLCDNFKPAEASMEWV